MGMRGRNDGYSNVFCDIASECLNCSGRTASLGIFCLGRIQGVDQNGSVPGVFGTTWCPGVAPM